MNKKPKPSKKPRKEPIRKPLSEKPKKEEWTFHPTMFTGLQPDA